MSSVYRIPPAKARVCRISGSVFVLCAVVAALSILLPGLAPGVRARCGDAGCVWSLRPSLMLDTETMAVVQASLAAERTFTAFAERPLIRAGVVGATSIETAPFALLLLGIGLALRRLGGGGPAALSRALGWLRLASQAALVWAIARPLSDSLMRSLLSAGTPEGRHWQISIDVVQIGTPLLLGTAAFSAVWALEAGLKAQRDLDDFV